MYEQHTAGPWHYTHETNAKRARGKFLIVFPVGCTVPICDVNRHRGPASEANAKLIATAPELLAALRKINARLCACGGPTSTEIVECRALAQSAITKAEGQP